MIDVTIEKLIVEYVKNDFVRYPDSWPPYYNGCNEPCEFLQGPCVCGAHHFLSEWLTQPKKKDLEHENELLRKALKWFISEHLFGSGVWSDVTDEQLQSNVDFLKKTLHW